MANEKKLHRVVRGMCLECVGGSTKAVRECTTATCKAWPFRLPDGECAVQMSLLTCNDRELFKAALIKAVEHAEQIPQPLSWVMCASAVRAVLDVDPLEPNWFGGQLPQILKLRGYSVFGYGKSTVESRKGGLEALWERK